MDSSQLMNDSAIQALRTSFDAQVDAVYAATYSAKVRKVLASGGVPVLAQGSPHTPNTLGPGWGFHVDEAFVKSVITRDLTVAMGLVPTTHSVDLKMHVASIGDVHGDCSARLLADKLRPQGPVLGNRQPITNIALERLFSSVVHSIESRPSDLQCRQRPSSESADGAVQGGFEIVDPVANLDRLRVQFLLTNSARGNLEVIGRSSTDGLMSTCNQTWDAGDIDLASTLPIRYATGTYLFATEFVYVTSRVVDARDGSWLAEFLSKPSPWVTEHVLPRIRMRQMLQVSLAQSITASTPEERRSAILKLVSTPELPPHPAAMKAHVQSDTKPDRQARCRI